jgi:hypothetical protein
MCLELPRKPETLPELLRIQIYMHVSKRLDNGESTGKSIIKGAISQTRNVENLAANFFMGAGPN